LADVLIL